MNVSGTSYFKRILYGDVALGLGCTRILLWDDEREFIVCCVPFLHFIQFVPVRSSGSVRSFVDGDGIVITFQIPT